MGFTKGQVAVATIVPAALGLSAGVAVASLGRSSPNPYRRVPNDEKVRNLEIAGGVVTTAALTVFTLAQRFNRQAPKPWAAAGRDGLAAAGVAAVFFGTSI